MPSEIEELKKDIQSLKLEISIVAEMLKDHLDTSGNFRDELIRIVKTRDTPEMFNVGHLKS